MSNTGTPPGWYPDPENPGQSRYWDGSAWAAPAAQPTPSPIGDGSGGSKTPLIVLAIIAVVALIGGGAFFLLSGDDDKDDDERVVVDDDDRDDDDDDDDGPSVGGGASVDVEELSADEFADQANGACLDLEDGINDVTSLYFGDVPPDEIEDLPSSVLSAFDSDVTEVLDDSFGELREIGPEGDVDEWLDLVDDWEELYREIAAGLADGDIEAPLRLGSDVDGISDRVEDFGLDCLSGDTPIDGPSVGGTDGGDGPSVGGSDAVGDPDPVPSNFEDPSLEPLGEACHNGDFEACDELYFQSPFDSPEEEYGDTCGGRTDGGTLCEFLDD